MVNGYSKPEYICQCQFLNTINHKWSNNLEKGRVARVSFSRGNFMLQLTASAVDNTTSAVASVRAGTAERLIVSARWRQCAPRSYTWYLGPT